MPTNKQTQIKHNTNANSSIPYHSNLPRPIGLENISIPLDIDNIVHDKHILCEYDDLAIPHIIRKQER